MTKTKIVNKNNPWWTPQLEDLRKEVTLYKKIYNYSNRQKPETI